jgi:hypothetical protein
MIESSEREVDAETGYKLDGSSSPGRGKILFLLYVVQSGCGVHPMGNGDSLSWGKAVEA